ncbi:hypothetical protein [Streptomyces sp. SID12501]|uniref:Uncharacterized protein n=1 Tax=Streptomyces sp. SID12501 TaxID=2706042 RepID=A0A6B3BP55_9ACTN|nr:hypothetical protein [Streptomyces sp. SID12501]NEC86125.1 hypothetical protein [Streptomyces sp. SID12501]
MDLQATIAGFRNVAPLDGLDGAWRWSLNPVLHFAGALTDDGKRLLQTNQRGRHDEGLAREVLSFARAHERELTEAGSFLGFVEGLRVPGFEFDAVAAAVPEVHGHHKAQNPDLTAVTYVVFPAYACEFSGGETLAEAEARYTKMLHPAEIGREPVPFVKMSFDNPRTGGGSNNPGRALTYPRIVRQEIPELANSAGGFVEFENRLGKVWRVEWDGGWIVSEEQSGVRSVAHERREMSLDEVLELFEGALREGTRQ